MKIVNQLASWILRHEIKASDQILVNQSKLIHLLVSKFEESEAIAIQRGVDMSASANHALQVDKERNRLKDQLFTHGKVIIPNYMFKGISDWLPDPNFVALVPTKDVNDELCRHIRSIDDVWGVHFVTGKVYDHPINGGYNKDNLKYLVIRINDYNFTIEVQLVKRQVRYAIQDCTSEITTHVWALGNSVQLISDQAWGSCYVVHQSTT